MLSDFGIPKFWIIKDFMLFRTPRPVVSNTHKVLFGITLGDLGRRISTWLVLGFATLAVSRDSSSEQYIDLVT